MHKHKYKYAGEEHEAFNVLFSFEKHKNAENS